MVTFHQHPEQQPTPAEPYSLSLDSAYCPVSGFMHQAVPSTPQVTLTTVVVVECIELQDITSIHLLVTLPFNMRAPPLS